jgi:hypothetical protein
MHTIDMYRCIALFGYEFNLPLMEMFWTYDPMVVFDPLHGILYHFLSRLCETTV